MSHTHPDNVEAIAKSNQFACFIIAVHENQAVQTIVDITAALSIAIGINPAAAAATLL